eukprot:1442445-Pyramimonas_sp.AAC.1
MRMLRNTEGALGVILGLVWGSVGAVSIPSTMVPARCHTHLLFEDVHGEIVIVYRLAWAVWKPFQERPQDD